MVIIPAIKVDNYSLWFPIRTGRMPSWGPAGPSGLKESQPLMLDGRDWAERPELKGRPVEYVLPTTGAPQLTGV